MPSLNHACINDDSDEDCNKCVKHGYVYSCAGCKDYEDLFGNKERYDGWGEDDE